MLILAKAVMGLMLGFFLAIVCGLIIIPLLRKLNVGQNVSKLINKNHLKKAGTPTMGGFIFIIPVLVSIAYLYFTGSIGFSSNLLILFLLIISLK